MSTYSSIILDLLYYVFQIPHISEIIYLSFSDYFTQHSTLQITGGNHKAHGPNPALHLVLSGPVPCFYPAAVLSSCLTVKEQLHLYSPKIMLGPLKATTRLMWPLMKMSLTPLLQIHPYDHQWQDCIFLHLSSIPLYICNTSSLSICLSIDTQIISMACLL